MKDPTEPFVLFVPEGSLNVADFNDSEFGDDGKFALVVDYEQVFGKRYSKDQLVAAATRWPKSSAAIFCSQIIRSIESEPHSVDVQRELVERLFAGPLLEPLWPGSIEASLLLASPI